MPTASIVVGLGYGDEGKGVTTDYLCSHHPKSSCVVRFSGGQQAGHTVMLGDIKHIHSNFGSGTLRGVPSYFSEHTTFYPLTIAREMKILKQKGIRPSLTIHPLAKMTTPYDVYANMFCEETKSHGTCGMGVGKTMHRNLTSPYQLYAVDLLDMDILMNKLSKIKEYYSDVVKKISSSVDFTLELEEFYIALEAINWNIKDNYHLLNYPHLIFEGSQGILLDMDHGVFPHVTYSNTTSKNAMSILDELNIKNRNMYYVTRAYSTRHGAGPFVEAPLKLKNNEHEINHYNDWQKKFKIGHLDYNKLNYALAVDKIYSKNCTRNLVVTCLDQIDTSFKYQNLQCGAFNHIYENSSPKSETFKIIR